MGTPLFTVAELRAIEQAAQRDLPPGDLMARAGRGAARCIDALFPDRRASVCVVAGPGNNGGDGFVIASELVERGHDVVCVLLGATEPTAADAHAAFARWRGAGHPALTHLPDRRFDIVVDGLFGIGLARPLAGVFLEAARWMDGHGDRIVAIDVPSGLDADRGAWVGGVEGVRANLTVTFIGDKPGLHTGVGCDAAGEVRLEALGLSPDTAALQLVSPDDFAEVTRSRRRDTHKGSFGNVLVLGGGVGMVGAPLLAARAALRLGAGRVYVDCIGAPELRVDPVQPELMFRPHATLGEVECNVVGCGLGTDAAAQEATRWALDQPHALVADADALNLIAANTALANALAARTAPSVLTPHPLEAARLLRVSAGEVQSDRLAAARALSRATNAIVVLKGAGTVIAGPDDRSAINPTGSPALATAGTGDVLAGMLGALLAQGFAPWAAVVAAVWLHGASVDGLGDVGVVAGDLAPRAVAALRRLRDGL